MEFKSLVAKKRLTMGKLLVFMIKEYSKSADKIWDKILYGNKIISDERAKEIQNITKKIRKEKWVRNAPYF